MGKISDMQELRTSEVRFGDWKQQFEASGSVFDLGNKVY